MHTNLFRFSWLMLLFLCVMASATLAQDHLPAHVVGGAYTKEWLLLGPFFPDNLETDFLINAGGEAEIHPKAGDIVTRANGTTLTWRRHTTSRHINLNSSVGGSDDLTAYAFTLLHSDTVADICIRLTGDDGVRVVLNA